MPANPPPLATSSTGGTAKSEKKRRQAAKRAAEKVGPGLTHHRCMEATVGLGQDKRGLFVNPPPRVAYQRRQAGNPNAWDCILRLHTAQHDKMDWGDLSGDMGDPFLAMGSSLNFRSQTVAKAQGSIPEPA